MEKHKIDIHKIISTITAIIIAAGAVVGALYIINPDIFKSKNICNDCEKRPCECATFISITPPTAIIRNNGVAKTNQGLNLPPTVTIITSEGEVQASVTWDLNSFIYNPSITTAQGFIAKGIITLPEDVKNPDNILLEVEIIVIVNEKTTDTCFSHEYDGSGYCIYCNYEYNINWTTYNIPRIYKTVVSYEESRIRVRPYSTASYRQVEYGTEFTIVAFGRSSNETLWYLTSTDEYIFSQRVEYVREA